MSEARKIFPMDTFVACLKGDENASVAEMLGYLTLIAKVLLTIFSNQP